MATQCETLLIALRFGPVTKRMMLDNWGILNGGGRIQDLRDAGHDIRTDMIEVRSRNGSAKVARYTLVRERKQ